jgi:hypothetical protein
MIEIDFISSAKEKKALNKPFRTPSGPKKFSVYVKNDKGNIVKVNFGDPNMEIKRDDPNRRKNYRARHHCENPGPKWKANYWSCKMWSAKPVSKITGEESEANCGCASVDEGVKNYMFFQNLKTIKQQVEQILAMDVKEVDALLSDGHDWANDHVTTAKTDLDGVYHFLSNKGQEPENETLARKQGLWDNIRKKKERMGKNYRPAKPNEEGYPEKDAWEKAQAEEHGWWDGVTFYSQNELLKEMPELLHAQEVNEDSND